MGSTREAYGQALAMLGEKYDYHVFDADLSKATQTIHFAKKYPQRFHDMGIAEGNMFGYSAGFASCGATVFASTFAMFAAGRAYEQIRNSIAYPNLNVKIGATHGGVLIGADGGSHQCVEDISLMRTLPHMTVLYPADTEETYRCVEAAIRHPGPVYLRFGRAETPEIYGKKYVCKFEIGKGTVLKDGKDACIIAAGDMVSRGLEAVEALRKEGYSVALVDMASIKPIDKELICHFARRTGAIVTGEDHSIIGGLGSAVAEVLVKDKPVPMEMVGIQDHFGRSGSPADLEKYFHITSEDLVKAVKKAMGRKEQHEKN